MNELLIAAALGLVVGFGIALLIYLLRRSTTFA